MRREARRGLISPALPPIGSSWPHLLLQLPRLTHLDTHCACTSAPRRHARHSMWRLIALSVGGSPFFRSGWGARPGGAAGDFHLCHAMCLSSQQRAETRVLSDTPSDHGYMQLRLYWRLAVGRWRSALPSFGCLRAGGACPCAVLPGVPRAPRGRSVHVSCIGHRASLWLFSSRIGFV